jgi:hypothetical protein
MPVGRRRGISITLTLIIHGQLPVVGKYSTQVMVGDITLHCMGLTSVGVWCQEVVRLLVGLAFVAFIPLLACFEGPETI